MERKSYRISKAGSLKRLRLVNEEINKPAENEVCIKIKAIGLNFADVFTIMGLYKAAPKKDFIPGLEFSGIVQEKGTNVKDFDVNDRVMGVIRFGAFTNYLNINYNYLQKLPENWSFEEGASFLVQALTAYYAMVHLGNVCKDQTVLIHSAAGGVGIYVNRIAKKFSAFTICTIGNPEKVDFLKNEGCNRIIVRNNNLKEEILKSLNGRELNLVMESIGGKVQKIGFDLLAPTGKMIIYGLSDYSSPTQYPNYLKLAYKFLTRPKVDGLTLVENNKSVMGFNLIWLYERVELLKDFLNKISALNLGKPFIGHVFNFGELINAIQLFQSGKTKGKVVIKL
jgi:alcohol dehydrogenase